MYSDFNMEVQKMAHATDVSADGEARAAGQQQQGNDEDDGVVRVVV